MKNRSKGIALVIIALILVAVIVVAGVVVYFVVFAPKPGEGPGPGPGPGFQITEIEDYGDLVNIVSHIKYKFISYVEGETSVTTITFDDLGDDLVNGYACRKLGILIDSDGYVQEITAWVLKSDWTTLKKLVFNGQIVPEEELPLYNYIESFVLWPFITFHTWGIYWVQIPPAIGTLTYMGSEGKVYGATALTVNKWHFIPNPTYEPLEDINEIDVWQGQTGNYYILTYFKVMYKDSSYIIFELLELTL
ncbi:MAG: hypothetical protein QXL52_02635 [Nitrososphaerales archaeon]